MSISVFKIVEPWLDWNAFDDLSDDEANDRSDELEESTGIGAPLREDAPEDVKQAYAELVKEYQESKKTGIMVD